MPNNNGTPDGIVARYDTQATFAVAGSWSFFDTATLDAGAKGFYGTAFDGRFVYFVPNNNGAPDGILARYDTTADFAVAGSWSIFDMTTIHVGAKGFGSAIFDGRFVYFVPNNNGVLDGVVVRFDAKFPPSMPAGYRGSFL